jgi:hypothetical protein
MIIDNFNVLGAILPREDQPPLVVDPDRVLAFSIALQSFQLVPWRETKVLECYCGIEHLQLSLGGTEKIRGETLGRLAGDNGLNPFVSDRPKHIFNRITS